MTPNTDQSSRISGPHRRRAYWLAAVGYAALAIYGSLVPLQYQPLAWAEAADRFRRFRICRLDSGGRADWVANILLFVPLAYLLMGALTLDTRSRAWRLTAAVLTVLTGFVAVDGPGVHAALVSSRTVSQNDVVAESLGAALGVVLWMAVGQGLVGVAAQQQARAATPGRAMARDLSRWLRPLFSAAAGPDDQRR